MGFELEIIETVELEPLQKKFDFRKTKAIIVGVGEEYSTRNGSKDDLLFPGLPEVLEEQAELIKILQSEDVGILEKNIEVLINEEKTAFIKAVQSTINDNSIDSLIIYLQVVGFKKRKKEKSEDLIINFKETYNEEESYSLNIRDLNKILSLRTDLQVIIFLDCNFSGLAINKLNLENVILITSSGSNERAHRFKKEKLTSIFTSELVLLTKEGIENRHAYLSLHDFFLELRKKVINKSYQEVKEVQEPRMRSANIIPFYQFFKNNTTKNEIRRKDYTMAELFGLINENKVREVLNHLKITIPDQEESSKTILNFEQWHSRLETLKTFKKIEDKNFKFEYKILISSLKEFLNSNESLLYTNINEAAGSVEKPTEKTNETPSIKDLETENSKKTILFLSAAPDGLETLRFGEEVNAIKDILKSKRKENSYRIEDEYAVIAENLPEILREHKPFILHISLHSSQEKGLLFQNKVNKKHPVNGNIIAKILKLLEDSKKHRVHCVLLNACQSNGHAQVLKEAVDYAIGMEDDIPDRAALAFTKGFYNIIFEDMDIASAFAEGKLQIELMGIPKIREDASPNHELPHLFYNKTK